MVNTKIRLIIFFAAKDGEALYSQQKQTNKQKKKIVVCGSDHELLIAKFRLKLEKVGKTTRPFSYDLNQIPYSGSDKQIQGIRSDRMPKELPMEVRNIVQEVVIKTIPKKKKGKMGI